MSVIETISALDRAAAEAIARLHSPALDAIFKFITHFGDIGGIWLLAAILMLLFLKPRSEPLKAASGMLLSTLAVNCVIKPIVGRARPLPAFPGIEPLIAMPADGSFPSGHAAFAFAASYGIARTLGMRYAVVSYLLAFIIAFSRLWVGVHYLSDIIGGIVIGTIAAIIGYAIAEHIVKRVTERKKKSIERN